MSDADMIVELRYLGYLRQRAAQWIDCACYFRGREGWMRRLDQAAGKIYRLKSYLKND
jgi:hypothetical protein